MKAWRIVVAVFSSIFGLAAIACLVGGIFLAVASGTMRDSDGFFTGPDYGLSTAGSAIVSDRIDIASRTGDWFPSDFLTVRFSVDSSEPAFVGIGPSDDVDSYLQGVARAEVTRLGPSRDDVVLRERVGGVPPSAPAGQDFWVVSDEGTDPAFEWDVERGAWTVVVMNADGSSPVTVGFEAAARVTAIVAIAVGLILFGLLVGVLAAFALVWATRRRQDEMEGQPVLAAPTGVGERPYPLVVEGSLEPGLSRGLWLVKWLLAIPHFIVLAFLWAAFVLLTIVAFFAIAFTGRYPRGIFDFNVGVMRWTWRVTYYTYGVGGTDEYPPFALRDLGDYPARLDVEYPERLSRGLVWVKSWLLALPHLIIVGFLTSGLVWWTTDAFGGGGALRVGGGLIGILVFVALLGLLFTGRYPRGLFDLVMGFNRWSWRVGAYVALMTDEYPPFRLDLGAAEPEMEERELPAERF
jgi:hypothetical protein